MHICRQSLWTWNYLPCWKVLPDLILLLDMCLSFSFGAMYIYVCLYVYMYMFYNSDKYWLSGYQLSQPGPKTPLSAKISTLAVSRKSNQMTQPKERLQNWTRIPCWNNFVGIQKKICLICQLLWGRWEENNTELLLIPFMSIILPFPLQPSTSWNTLSHSSI